MSQTEASEADICQLEIAASLIRVETPDEDFHFLFPNGLGAEGIVFSRHGWSFCEVLGTSSGSLWEERTIRAGGKLWWRKGEKRQPPLTGITKVSLLPDGELVFSLSNIAASAV